MAHLGPSGVIVPCDPTPAMLREGARALQAWADETLREEVDDIEMARRVWKAMTSNAD